MGVSVLTLPRLASADGKPSGVVITLIGGILSIITAAVVGLLCKKFPNKSIVEFLPELIGKIPAFFYILFFILYSLLVSGGTLRAFSDALKAALLPKTPLEVIILVMLFTCLYMVVKGIDTISKICELFFPLIVISIGLVLLFNISDINWVRFRSIFSPETLPCLKRIPNLFGPLLGYEVLFLITPYMRKPDKGYLCGILGSLTPTIIYVGLVVTAVGIFGAEATGTMVYPTITLAKRISFPGGFLERFDIFFIIFWTLAAFTTVALFYYISSVTITKLIKMKNYKPFMFVIAPIIYFISITPQNFMEIEQLLFIAGIMGIITVCSSFLFYLISIIKKKGGQ